MDKDAASLCACSQSSVLAPSDTGPYRSLMHCPAWMHDLVLVQKALLRKSSTQRGAVGHSISVRSLGRTFFDGSDTVSQSLHRAISVALFDVHIGKRFECGCQFLRSPFNPV